MPSKLKRKKKITTKKTEAVDTPKPPTMPETLENLSQQIHRWNKELTAANSFRNKFIGGLLTGFGTVLGATLLVALLVFILSQLASIELIRPFIEEITHIVQRSK